MSAKTSPQTAAPGFTAITLPDVCSKTGLGRTTLYGLMVAGQFPKPAKVGRRAIWLVSEVDAWLEARFAERSEVQL